jgi:hypothetical protein
MSVWTLNVAGSGAISTGYFGYSYVGNNINTATLQTGGYPGVVSARLAQPHTNLEFQGLSHFEVPFQTACDHVTVSQHSCGL